MIEPVDAREVDGLAERAIAFAGRALEGRVDKAGQPRWHHCMRVAASLHIDDERAVGALHDVIEDSGVSLLTLRDHFPERIVDAVLVLTRVDGQPPDLYYARIRANPLALAVKLADLYDNLDPRRLALLDPSTAQRLRRKYANALLALA